ncbi:allantoicase [bacterium]|nr:allantoicase [bacterium]
MNDSNGLPEWLQNKVDLASPRLGGEVVYATNEFFAAKERIIQQTEPVFVPGKFDEHGKWMDGWETQRRRNGCHDWCLVKLGVKGIIAGVDIDTSHFTGNYPPAAAVEAVLSETEPDDTAEWSEIVPAVSLSGNSHHFVAVSRQEAFDYLRLHMFPDGGIARFRVYGQPVCEWDKKDKNAIYELSAMKNGGRIVAYNDAHFADPWQILTEGRGKDMGDGWETRRRRTPGNDWIIIALGAVGNVEKIEIDTAHFKGNYPDCCSIMAARVESATDQSLVTQSMFWETLMSAQKMQADTIHHFGSDALNNLGAVSHVRLNIHPDGGISRIRIFGTIA